MRLLFDFLIIVGQIKKHKTHLNQHLTFGMFGPAELLWSDKWAERESDDDMK